MVACLCVCVCVLFCCVCLCVCVCVCACVFDCVFVAHPKFEPMIPARGPQTMFYISFRVLIHGVFYSGYSCSKTQSGTGGSREAPVPVKRVQAIQAIAAR